MTYQVLHMIWQEILQSTCQLVGEPLVTGIPHPQQPVLWKAIPYHVVHIVGQQTGSNGSPGWFHTTSPKVPACTNVTTSEGWTSPAGSWHEIRQPHKLQFFFATCQWEPLHQHSYFLLQNIYLLTRTTCTPKPFQWRLKSPASRLFTQPFIQTQIKENIKAPRHWPLCGEFAGAGEFPPQMASNVENVSIWWRNHVPCQFVVNRCWCGDPMSSFCIHFNADTVHLWLIWWDRQHTGGDTSRFEMINDNIMCKASIILTDHYNTGTENRY